MSLRTIPLEFMVHGIYISVVWYLLHVTNCRVSVGVRIAGICRHALALNGQVPECIRARHHDCRRLELRIVPDGVVAARHLSADERVAHVRGVTVGRVFARHGIRGPIYQHQRRFRVLQN
jgi:hypothetical protein